MTGEGEPQTRDGFSGKRGFILSSIGSAVGMANIWRFPAMVSLWGGLTFIIPYLIFVVLITATGVIGEFTLGRAAKAGPCGAFGMCTEHRFGNRRIGERIGLIPVVGSLALAIGYTCVVAWIIKYTFMAFDGELFAMGQDMDAIAGMFNDTAGAWGANVWVIIAAVATMLIMSLGVSKGIEKANNVLMPLLFALLIGLTVYVATLPGATAGYSYILTIDLDLLANPLVWVFAFGQAFFSLSVAGNGSVIYGSYFKKNESIPSAAFYVALFDTVSAILAAMIIIPAMAAAGAELNEGGPGLMFIYIVNVFNGMPVRRHGVHRQPVRDPRVLPAGEVRYEPCEGDGLDGRAGWHRRTLHTVRRVSLDGWRLNIHLPSRCAPRSDHAVLGRRKGIRRTQRERGCEETHREMVRPHGEVRVLRAQPGRPCRWSAPRRHRMNGNPGTWPGKGFLRTGPPACVGGSWGPSSSSRP